MLPGYRERWAEYRYHPALITGRFRSTAASTLDSWHLAQKFSSRPLLNNAFINEDPPIARVSAVNTSLLIVGAWCRYRYPVAISQVSFQSVIS